MSRIITGLDIGSSTITTIIGQKRGDGELRVLGVAVEPADGIRKGVVIDVEDATQAIRRSLSEAARVADASVRSVILSVSGSCIHVNSSRGVVAVSRADGEISEEDISRVFSAAESFIPKNPNREIIHLIPREFKVDGEIGVRDPIGMNGVRLEVDALVLEAQTHSLRTLTKCIETAGSRPEGIVFSALAASDAVLTKKQKELGVMLVDIGGGTADFIVYEEGRIIHAGSLPVGGNHITNDIAIGFQTQVSVAEHVKRAHGVAVPELVGKKDTIRLADFSPGEDAVFPKKELADIIEARLKDLFELLNRELKKANRLRLLPAGAVLVGGGARMPGIAEIARREMHLPVSIGVPYDFGALPFDEESSTQLAASLGLLRWGTGERRDTFLGGNISKTLPFMKGIMKLFLP